MSRHRPTTAVFLLNFLIVFLDRGTKLFRYRSFLDDDEEDRCRSLVRLRELKLDAGGHDHSWHEGVHACAVQFDVGDVGYISGANVDLLDKDRFNNFVKIGNVLERTHTSSESGNGVQVPFASQIPVVREASGMQTQWVNGFFNRQDVYPFILPGELEGYDISFVTR